MAKLFDKMLNLVGWEEEQEEEEKTFGEIEDENDEYAHPNFFQPKPTAKKQSNKLVNIRTNSNFKVVVMQPENYDDAQDICDHLKNKKPVVINLEKLDKDFAQKLIDFLSGAVYSLEGNIQKVAAHIFIIAPKNVDIQSEFKQELKNSTAFPWAK